MIKYISQEEVLGKKEWSYDLKQYVVPVRCIKSLAGVTIDQSDAAEVNALKEAAKALFNRCAVQSGGVMCAFCGFTDLCGKYRSAFQEDGTSAK